MNWNRNILLSIAAIIALWVLLFFALGNSHKQNETPRLPDVPVSEKSDAAAGSDITFLFAGDIMLSRTIGSIMEKKDDYDFPYALMGDTITGADIAFANLETPVSANGTNVGSIYSFRTDPKALSGLKRAGFDVVSMANNHIWDWGRVAFLDTIANLDEYGIMHAGGGATFADAHAPTLLKSKGHTVAVLAYTKLVPPFLSDPDSAPAVAYPNSIQIAKDIADAKALGADIVIASFHWGTEYETTHDSEQERLAHAAIDAGARIVVGHHPHVVQDIERYKDGLIIYSLGNFVFDQNFSPDTNHGLIVGVKAGDHGIVSVEPMEVRFDSSYQPFVTGPWQ